MKLDCRITFIRHGHPVDEKIDKLRPLSLKGRSQAASRALELKTHPVFDLVISSSATRAKETAKIIMDELDISTPIVELATLYEPCGEKDRTIVNMLLEELGSVPLNIYKQHDVHGSWNRYSESAYEAIRSVIEQISPVNVLVVAHGNIINAAGLLLSNCAELNEVYFNYCEGFEIYRGKCKLMQFR